MKIQKNSKWVMIGDSITDVGRQRPVGEGLFEALGKGYPALASALLGAAYPELGIRVVNMGCGGDTIRNLRTRWGTDVLDLHPDWLSILIGINDVWRQYDTPCQPEWAVPLDEFKSIYEELIAQTAPSLKGLILVTPYYIEPNRKDPMRATMDRYGAAVKQLAKKHNAYIVDTQAAIDKALEHYYPGTLSWDRVHPNLTGHMILAQTILKAVGFSR